MDFITKKLIARNNLQEPFETITHGFNCVLPKTSHYVIITNNDVKIYIQSKEQDIDIDKWYIRENLVNANKDYYDILVYDTTSFEGFFPGMDFNEHHGGSILILLESGNNKYKYLHVQDEIFIFETDEPINIYYTNVGNSDVHYSYGISDTKSYLMREYVKMIMPVEYSKSADPYDIYYNMFKNDRTKYCESMDVFELEYE